MPITIVQTAKNAAQQSVPANSTGTLALSAVFANPITAGNAIVVIVEVDCAIGNDTGGGIQSTSTPLVTDSLGNSYTSASFVNGGIFIPGTGVFFKANSLGGANTVTWSIRVPNANPLFPIDQGIALIAVEVAGAGASPSVQAGNTSQQAGSGPVAVTLTDSFGVSVGTNFGTRSQTSAAVADLAVSGVDFFIASLTSSTTGAPIVTPSGYMSYTLLDTAVAGAKTYLTAYYGLDGATLGISCGSPPAGVKGSPYSHLFPTTGGIGPFVYSITSGSLPPGLSLDISTGSVSGIPTATGTSPVTIQVVDSSAATSSVSCSISIAPGGAWIIQEITAELIPCDPEIPGFGHFRYTVRCVDAAQAGTWLGFWDSFGGGGSGDGGGGASASGTSLPPAPPEQPPGGATVVGVEHNGTLVGSERDINFIDGVHSTVTVTDDPTNSRVNVTVDSGPLVEVALLGALAGTEPEINFIPGSNISIGVADNPGNSRVDVTISSSGSSTYTSLAKYTASWTSQTSVTVTHNLGTTAVLVQVYDAAGLQVEPQSVTVTSGNVVTLTFGASFTGSVVILGSSTRSLSSVYTTSWTAQTSVTVTHNLGSLAVVVQVFDSAGVQVIPQNVAITSANVVTLTFGAAFTGSAIVVAQPPRPVQSYSTSWTAQTSVTVTHNLGTSDVIVQVYDASGNEAQPQAITVIDANSIQIDFGASFSGSVTVLG